MDKSLKGLDIEEIIQEIGLYMPILDTIACFKNDKTAEEFYEIVFISLFNTTHWTSSCTCTAAYTFVCNFVCHLYHSLHLLPIITAF